MIQWYKKTFKCLVSEKKYESKFIRSLIILTSLELFGISKIFINKYNIIMFLHHYLPACRIYTEYLWLYQ